MADAFAEAAAARSGPTSKELNQEVMILALGDRVKTLEADLKSAEKLVISKNDQIIRLETENVRLKMTRTDKELAVQVDGLRAEVGKKDRELVVLKRSLATFQENEALTLRRAASAEQKILIMQTTMGTMQKAREAAHAEVERHDRERLEAVRVMIDAQDRAKKAEARVAELERKGKPIAPNDNALKVRKK